MIVDDITLIEVGDMEEQFRKPYNVSADGEILKTIESLIVENGGSISNDLFISAASSAFRLSSESEEVGIAGQRGQRAWRERRYRFIANVTLENYTRERHVASRAIVIGYTDRVDLSHNNTVADDLRLYVNTVAVVRDIQVNDNGRIRVKSKLVSSQQTLLGDLDLNRGNVDYLMRPFDIFNTIDTHKEVGRDGDHIDLRSTFQYGVVLNGRHANDSNRYLSSVVQADRQGLTNVETYSNDIMEQSRDTEAADIVRPTRLQSNLFLKAIASRSDYAENNYFEYQDLAELTEGRSLKALDAVTRIAPMVRNTFSYESEQWYGASPETMAAIQICHAVPIIMLDCLFSYVDLTISNTHDRSNRTEILVHDMSSYIGDSFDDRRILEAFEGRIEREVFNPISSNGYFDVSLDITSEVGGLTRIMMSIDGGPETPYVFPTFADAMLTPMITRDKSVLDDNAEGYVKLRRIVDDTVGGSGQTIDTSSRFRNGRVETAPARTRTTGIDLLDIDLPRRKSRVKIDIV